MNTLYIAFGSNLCKRQMRRRCFSARPLGKFYLTSARLVFRGVADLEYDANSRVPCGLWSITSADEAALDRCEGVARGTYFKSWDVVLRYQGEPRHALLYLMRSERVLPPKPHYIDTIRQGYRDFGLDQSYLDDAIEYSMQNKTDSNQRRASLFELPFDPQGS